MKTMKKISVVFLTIALCANLFLVSTPTAQAIFGFGDIVYDPINYAVNGLKLAANYVSNLSAGLPGTGATTRAALKAGKKPCDVFKKANDIVSTADNFGAVAVIAGSAGEISKLSTKITALTVVKNCYAAILDVSELGGAAIASVAGGQQSLSALGENTAQLQALIDTLDLRLDKLVELRDNAVKELWKGVAIRVLYNVQQRITTKLVNKMIATYKIPDFSQYADAVSSQIYTLNYVQQNHPKNSDQMLVKSILQNPLEGGKVLPIVRAEADSALGFVPDELDVSDPNYYVKMAQAGSGKADPFYLQTSFQDKADTVQGQAQAAAQQEISQGQGLMPVRHCTGLAESEKISDGKRQELQTNLQVKQLAFDKMRSAQLKDPKSVSADDFNKAVTDLAQARTDLVNFADTNKAYIKRCEDIANPASAVSSFTTSFLQSHLIAANTPKSENLPFFATFMEGVATNFISNFIETGKPNIQLLTNAGFASANIVTSNIVGNNPETGTLKQAENSAQKTAVFVGVEQPTAGQYKLAWDASGIAGAKYVNITAGTFQYQSQDLNGSVIATAPGNTRFVLDVKDSNNKTLDTQGFITPTNPNPSLNFGANNNTLDVAIGVVGAVEGGLKGTGQIKEPVTCPNGEVLVDGGECPPPVTGTDTGTVNGAFASKLSVPIRGPVGIHPRGE